MIKHERVRVTTTGSAGSATGSATTADEFHGFLHKVRIDYHASAPATTDLTLVETEAASLTLLTLTNNNSDGTYLPREAVHDNAGTGVTYDGTRPIYERSPVSGHLTVSLAQADALTDCVVVDIYVEE